MTGTSTATQLRTLVLALTRLGPAVHWHFTSLDLVKQYKWQAHLGCRGEGAGLVRVYHIFGLYGKLCTAGEYTRCPVVATTTSQPQPKHNARLRTPHHLQSRLTDLPPHLPHLHLLQRLTASNRHTRPPRHHKPDHERLPRPSRHIPRRARHHQERHTQVPSQFRFLLRPASRTNHKWCQWESIQVSLSNT